MGTGYQLWLQGRCSSSIEASIFTTFLAYCVDLTTYPYATETRACLCNLHVKAFLTKAMEQVDSSEATTQDQSIEFVIDAVGCMTVSETIRGDAVREAILLRSAHHAIR